MNFFLSITLLLSVIYSSNAIANTQVLGGTYVGNNGNRANISSYQDQGIYNYDLLLANMRSSDFYSLSTVQKFPFETGKSYTFKTISSEYDNNHDSISECSITAKFKNDGELELVGDVKCTYEISRLGLFVFSEQASFIPKQYWGKWGKNRQCTDVTAIIQKTWITNDSDLGAATVLNTENNKDGSLDIIGVESYEDILSSSRFHLRLADTKLYFEGSHHEIDFNQVLVKCSDQEF